MPNTITSREFNQDTAGAKRAADSGPVVITDRGRPAHVLLTFEAYLRLVGPGRLIDLLGEPPGVESTDLPLERSREPGRAAEFD